MDLEEVECWKPIHFSNSNTCEWHGWKETQIVWAIAMRFDKPLSRLKLSITKANTLNLSIHYLNGILE